MKFSVATSLLVLPAVVAARRGLQQLVEVEVRLGMANDLQMLRKNILRATCFQLILTISSSPTLLD
jgi:hypothetical protein